jgi:hypothetical protein
MENEKNITETKKNSDHVKDALRNNYHKIIQKLEQRNAHLKTNSENHKVKQNKNDIL